MLKIYNAGATNINVSIDSESYTLYPQYKLYIKNDKLSMIDNLSEIVQCPELTLVLDDLKGVGDELSILIPYYKDHSHIVDESFQIFGVIPNIGIADNHNCAIKPSRVGNSEPINYNHLHDKPQINGVTLMGGNNDARDLNLVKFEPTSSGGLRQGGSGLSDYNFTEADRAKLNAISTEALENINQINLKVNKETWIDTDNGELIIKDKVLSEKDYTNLDKKKLDSLPLAGDDTYRYATLRDLLEGTEYRNNGVEFYKSVDESRTAGGLIDDFGNAVLGKGYQVGQRLEWYPYGDEKSVCFLPLVAEVVSVSANEDGNRLVSMNIIHEGLFNTTANTIRLVNKNRYGDSQFTAALVTSNIKIENYPGKQNRIEYGLVQSVEKEVIYNDDGTPTEYRIVSDRIIPSTNENNSDSFISIPVLSAKSDEEISNKDIGLINGEEVKLIRSVDGRLSDLEKISGVTVKLSDSTCELSSEYSEYKVTYNTDLFNIRNGEKLGSLTFDIDSATNNAAGLLSSSDKSLLDNLRNGNIKLDSNPNNTLTVNTSTDDNSKGLFSTSKLYVDQDKHELGLQKYNPITDAWIKINDNIHIRDLHPDSTVTTVTQDKIDEITVGIRYWESVTDDTKVLVLPTYSTIDDSPITVSEPTVDNPVGKIGLNIDSENTSLTIADNKVSIGRGTNTKLGAIKSSDELFKVSISDDGIGNINGLSSTDIQGGRVLVTDNQKNINTDSILVGDLDKLEDISILTGGVSLKDYIETRNATVDSKLGRKIEEVSFPQDGYSGFYNHQGTVSLKLKYAEGEKSIDINIPSAYKDQNNLYHTGLLSKTDKEIIDNIGNNISNATKSVVNISDLVNSTLQSATTYSVDTNTISITGVEYTEDKNEDRGYALSEAVSEIQLPIISDSDKVLVSNIVDDRIVISSDIKLDCGFETKDTYNVPQIRLLGKDDSILGEVINFSDGFKLDADKIHLRPGVGLGIDDSSRLKLNTATDTFIGGILSSSDTNYIAVGVDGKATVSGLQDYQNRTNNRLDDLDDNKLDKQFDTATGDFGNKIVITDASGNIGTSTVNNSTLSNIIYLDRLNENVQDAIDKLREEKVDKSNGLVTGARVVESTENVTIELTSTMTDTGDPDKLEDLVLPNAHLDKGAGGSVYFPGLMSADDKRKLDLYPESGFDRSFATSGDTLKDLLDSKVDLNNFPTNSNKVIVTEVYRGSEDDKVSIKYDYVQLEANGTYSSGSSTAFELLPVSDPSLKDSDYGVIKVSEYRDMVNRTPPALPTDTDEGQYVLVAVKGAGAPTFEWRRIQF